MGEGTTGRAGRHILTVTLTHTVEGALHRPEDGGGHLSKPQAQNNPVESLRPQSSLGLLALLWGQRGVSRVWQGASCVLWLPSHGATLARVPGFQAISGKGPFSAGSTALLSRL